MGNKKNYVLFDLIRSIKKLAFVKKSKFAHTSHAQTYKEDNREMGLIIRINKIESTPAWNLPSL